MPIQKSVRNLEVRKDCLILHFDDGTELKFRMEDAILPNGKKVEAAVARYQNQVIWSSVDHK